MREIHQKQIRIRYIRVLEKFFNRTVSLLKLENFKYELFIERTNKNYEDITKVQKIDLNSPYLINLKKFIDLTLQYTVEHTKTFETERNRLLKEANLLQKEKNSGSYKKDKHKKSKFDDGY